MGTWTVLKWGLRNWYDEMVLFTVVGLVSFLLQLPFALLAFVLLAFPAEALLFLYPALAAFVPSPAVVGMYGLAHELARGEGISWTLFWSLTRRYWRRSLAVYLTSVVATAILFVSIRFYVGSENTALQWLGFAALYALIVWLIMQLYLLPLLLEQERWSLLRLYRNALIVVAAKPVLSLFLLIVSLLLVAVGLATVIGLPIVVLPLIAVLATHALHFAVYGPPQKPE